MEDKETLKSRFLKEIGKKGFRNALAVFFFCVITALIIGVIFDTIQLAATSGIGLGLIWMGGAYFNQKEGE